MADDPKLSVALEARLDKFERDLKRAGVIADREVSNIERSFARTNSGGGFFAGLLGGALGALSLDQIVKGVQRTVSEVGKLAEVTSRVGLDSSGQLQELQFALVKSGGSAEQATGALERFGNVVAKAADGEGRLGKFLVENNVHLKDRVTGALRPTAELLQEVANLIQNTASPQERLNIATEFFGRTAGPIMVEALKDGAEGLRKLGSEARTQGAVLDENLVQLAKEIDDRWKVVALTWSVTVRGAIITLIDAAQRASGAMNEWSRDASDVGKELAALTDQIRFMEGVGSPVPQEWLDRYALLLEMMQKGRTMLKDGLPAVPSSLPDVPNRGGQTDTSALRNKGQKEADDAFERATEQITKRTSLLETETRTIDLNAEARARARITTELETAARKANTDAGLANTEVTAEQRIKIDELANAYGQAAQKAEEANGPLRRFAREARDANAMLQDAAVSGLRGFEDALIGIGFESENVAEAFKKMANSILQDLARIAIRQAITGPIAAAFGGGFGFPSRDVGGNVTAGQSYEIGKGPYKEIFTPKLPGRITKGTTSGGGVTVIVNSSPVFQAGMTPTDMAAIDVKLSQNNQQLRGAILQDLRGGLRNDSDFLGRG